VESPKKGGSQKMRISSFVLRPFRGEKILKKAEKYNWQAWAKSSVNHQLF